MAGVSKIVFQIVRVFNLRDFKYRKTGSVCRPASSYDPIFVWLNASVFLNRRAAARYRALASVIPGRERFSWNLSF